MHSKYSAESRTSALGWRESNKDISKGSSLPGEGVLSRDACALLRKSNPPASGLCLRFLTHSIR